jgi:hypothetical protein
MTRCDRRESNSLFRLGGAACNQNTSIAEAESRGVEPLRRGVNRLAPGRDDHRHFALQGGRWRSRTPTPKRLRFSRPAWHRCHFTFRHMVEMVGFEPTTSWSRTRRAPKLRHISIPRSAEGGCAGMPLERAGGRQRRDASCDRGARSTGLPSTGNGGLSCAIQPSPLQALRASRSNGSTSLERCTTGRF